MSRAEALSAGGGHPFGRDYRALTFGVMINVSLIAFEAMSVATILPVAARDLGASSGYGWAFSAFMLANLIGTVATGQRVDRSGPAGPQILGLLAFAAGLLVAGFSWSWPSFIAGRMLQGLGGGALMTLAYLSIRRGYPEALRARMMALVSSSWILPSLLGPAVAGLLSEHLHWRWVFVGLLPLLPLSAWLMLPQLRKMPPSGGQHAAASLLPALQLAAGAGLLLASLQRDLLESLRLSPLWQIPLAVVGVWLVARGGSALFPRGMSRMAPGLPAGLVFRGLIAFSYFGSEAFVPLGMSLLRGLTTTQAGLFLTSASLTWVVGSWTQARIEGRRGPESRKARTIWGLALVTAGISLMVVTAALPLPVAFPLAGWALSGVGMGLAYPTSSLAVFSLTPEGQEGRISSALNLSENFGIALGAGLGGAAYDWARHLGLADTQGVLLAFAVALAPALLGYLAAPRTFAKS